MSDQDYGGTSREDFVAYASGLAGELARLAQMHRLPTLAYLFEIARLEARSQMAPQRLQPEEEPTRHSSLGTRLGFTAIEPARR